MDTNEPVEVLKPDLVVMNSHRMKRINRAYLRGTVARGVKWGLIAAGAVAVANHFRGDKDETHVEEVK